MCVFHAKPVRRVKGHVVKMVFLFTFARERASFTYLGCLLFHDRTCGAHLCHATCCVDMLKTADVLLKCSESRIEKLYSQAVGNRSIFG